MQRKLLYEENIDDDYIEYYSKVGTYYALTSHFICVLLF